ncbi:hypothetical protein GQ600_17111 [Phytophthora cactorum]|nr:hypothetical protein GQ600_17111 [Phytophthora cactorum]
MRRLLGPFVTLISRHCPQHDRRWVDILTRFFAVFSKAVRHYQRTGSSILLGHIEPFWVFQWVDDIVLIEIDMGDRLQKSENVSETESNSFPDPTGGMKASS